MIREIERAAELLEQVDPHTRLDLADLYTLGWVLQEITNRLAAALRLGAAPSVQELRDAANVADPQDAPVYDDTGDVHPHDRLSAAWQRLRELDSRLAGARDIASEYHSTIGHIGIRSGS